MDTPTIPPVQPPVEPPVQPPAEPPVEPPPLDTTSEGTDGVDDTTHDSDSECEPEDCLPHFVPMNVEIAPKIVLCVDKPIVHLKNNAICKCKPCKKKNKQ